MKHLIRGLVLILYAAILAVSVSSGAQAVDVTPSPPASQPAPDVFISAFAGVSNLDFVELYNQSDQPVDITNWSFDLTFKGSDSSGCADTNYRASTDASGWLRSKNYFTFEPANANQAANEGHFTLSKPLASCKSPQLVSLELNDASGNQVQIINLPVDASDTAWQHYQDGYALSSTRDLSGDFNTDYKPLADGAYSDELYQPPANASGLKIVEILPHSRNCSPTDASYDCSDYVKIFVPANDANQLANYRLRVGYQGQTVSSSNSFNLAAYPLNNHYLTINQKENDNAISITDSGGFAWLEDAGGVKIYEPVVEYPSASSETKIGAAWTLVNGTWQWTSTPNAFGPNNLTPLVASTTSPASASNLKACAHNQFRNPLTNRCKLVVTASTLVDCLPGQFRNPATNRCKSLLAAHGSLVACAANQYRNPATNRCKSTAASTGSLQPCQPGSTRNPSTNRCRKTSDVKGSSTIKDVKSPASAGNHTSWIIAALVLAAALAYAVYEWRQEFDESFRKIKSLWSVK